ncbi:MAG: translocation/assembly module TamB domain-containing protein, partial [Candidatus Kryptonium sp.]
VGFETMEARANIDFEESFVSKVLIPRSNFWVEVRGRELNGSFVSLAEGLRGVIDLNLKKLGEGEFLLSLSGSLADLDLSQVRVDKPHFLKSHISGDFNARFSFGEVSTMELFAQLNPSVFGNYKISRLRLNARYSGDSEKKSLIVQSNMFDLNLDGKFSFGDLANSLTHMFGGMSQVVYDKLNFSESRRFDFSAVKNPVYIEYRIKFKNLTPISLFSIGRLFQATGNLNGVFLADSQGFYFYNSSELKQIRYISYEKGRVDTFKSNGFNGEIELNYEGQLRFKLKGELKDFASNGFEIDKVGLSLNYNEPELYAEVFANGERWNFEAVSIGQFSREVNRFILKGFDGEVYGNKISISDDIEIFQSKSGIIINPSSFVFNEQRIYIGGFIDKQTQQLRIWGENLELDRLIKGKLFSGKVEFSFFIYGTHDKPNSNVEIFVKDFRYKNAVLGSLECFGKVEDELVSLNISLVVSAGEVNYSAMNVVLSSPAWFNPIVRSKYREPYVSGKIKLFRFPIAVFEPLLEGISDLKGDITAEIDLGGTFDKPSFKGDFSLQNCIFKFNPNGKYYLVYGVGKIDSNVIYVEDLNLWNNPDDYSSGEVRVNGKIYLGGYSISKGDFNITGKLLVMDKEGFGTTGLYGRVIAQTGGNGLSLKIDTTGFYLDGEIFLSDVDVNYFPKHSISAQQSTGFEYVYVSSVDTVKEEITTEELVHLNLPVKVDEIQNEGAKRQSIFSRFNYDLKIRTLNDAKLNILLNTQTGEEFFAEFSGNLNLRNYSGLVLAHGVVDILDRSYYNFFKRFNAKGKIKFVEDLKNPELDITAVYTGTHTVLTDTLSAGKVENVLIELLISGTLSKPVVKIQMYIDGEDYQKVYPHGEVESDAISFLVTGRFKDELSRSEVGLFTENLWSSTASGLLSGVVSGVVTDVLRDVLGGVVTAAEFGYYSGFKGLRITGNIGGAVVQIGGDIFTDISKSVVVVQYPLFKKFFGGNFTIEYQRKPIQFYQEKEILNKLGLYYRIRL